MAAAATVPKPRAFVKILERKGHMLRVLMKGPSKDRAYVNGLRRILMAEVPCLAIDQVTIETNTAITMQDQVLAHTLGMLPIVVTRSYIEGLNYPEDCTCVLKQGCDKCCVNFSLHVKHDLSSKEILSVTSDDLMIESNDHKSKEVFRRVKGMSAFTIVRLACGEEIKLTARAIKGYGDQHAKWSPVGPITFKSSEEVPGAFEFTLKSVGQLPPEDLMEMAMTRMAEKLREIQGTLK